jgi:hypothetical protein
MTENERTALTRTILRYFDGDLSTAEREVFEQRLCSDQDAALLFARIARLDDALRQSTGSSAGAAAPPLAASDESRAAAAPGRISSGVGRWFRLSPAWIAASVMMALAGALAGGASVEHVRGAENRELRHELLSLREFREHMARFVGAFSLALDRPDAPGPAALVVAHDTLVVAGAADPEVIDRVVIEWDQDDVETIVVAKQPSASTGLVRLFSRRQVPMTIGAGPRTVTVKAIPLPEQQELLETVRPDRAWLSRSTRFLRTPHGLVSASNLPITLQWPEGNRITDDQLPLTGAAHALGELAMVITTSEGRRHLLLPPTKVGEGQPLPESKLVFDYPNGPVTVDVVFLPTESRRWPDGFPSEAGDELPRDVTLNQLPDGVRRQRVTLSLDLPSSEHRVARRVFELGGSVKLHGDEHEAQSFESLANRGIRIQQIDLSATQVRDLSFIGKARTLQSLNVSHTPVDDQSITAIGELAPQLLYLFAGDTQITDVGVREGIARCRRLQSLLLGDTQGVTEKGLEAIAENLTNLRTLALAGTRVKSVAVLSKLPRLEQLTIEGLEIPTAEIDALRMSRPALQLRP